MSKFRKVSTAVAKALEDISGEIPEDAETKTSFLRSLQGIVEELEPQITKMLKNARETDPDKKLYGPKMTEKVLKLGTEYDSLRQLVLDQIEQSAGAFDAVEIERLRAQAAEEAKRKREAEEAAKKRELEQAEFERKEQERKERAAARLQEEEEKTVEEEKKRKAERAAYIHELMLKKQADEAAKDLNLHETLKIMEENSTAQKYKDAVQLLLDIVVKLDDEPSDPRCRHIRKENDTIKSKLCALLGGRESMWAIGFREKTLKEPVPGAYFVLPEPDITDVDTYMAQLDSIKEARATLEDDLSRVL